MKTITQLAKSRITFNKSRSILTIIAISLTTMMLMALGTSCIGLLDIEQQRVISQGSNLHASFRGLTLAQLEQLSHHTDLEALQSSEMFALVEYGKMNGTLSYTEESKGQITSGVGNLIEGRKAEKEDEIWGPPAFFERMGAEAKIGAKVTVPFRVKGEGEIITKDFTITGLISQQDVSKLNVSDTRIAYSASVSKALVKQYSEDDADDYRAMIRVKGEKNLNFDEIKQKIVNVAQDIGVSENNITYNSEYLYVMTEPGREILAFAIGIAVLIAVFAGLVIYSIYYVSVITDVQEIGKLKALGASKKQIKRLFLKEGIFLCLIAIPIGLILGYLVPKLAFPLIMKQLDQTDTLMQIHIFSLPITAAAAAVVLLTMYLSLLKPMRMAARISPIEAIRYQEAAAGKQAERKGYDNITVSRLSYANISRNRKRTLVTIITMGLSCVLFMSLAGVMNSMDREDFARRSIEKGSFLLQLDASYNDKEYPENNLNVLQEQDLLGADLVNRITAIPGVEKIESGNIVMIESSFPCELFENGRRTSLEGFTRNDIPQMKKDLKRGDLDYDKMVLEKSIIFQSDHFFEEYGLQLGDSIPLRLYSGDQKIELNAVLAASISGRNGSFGIAQELLDTLIPDTNTANALYIYADDKKYDTVKTALSAIADENKYFRLISLDEELRIADLSINSIKYPCYAILLMIGIIGFMNLINTMITSIITRKRELGILQAIGLSDKQLVKMLRKEGMVFTAGTLVCALGLGNIFGYLIFLYGKATGFMEVKTYHYPIRETIVLAAVLILGQLFITFFISRRVHKETLVERMKTQE